MLGVQEAEEQTHGDGLDLGFAHGCDGACEIILVERLELAVGTHPLAYGEAQVARHEGGRAIERQVV